VRRPAAGGHHEGDGRGSSDGHGGIRRNGLVIAQVALALVLLVGSGLMVSVRGDAQRLPRPPSINVLTLRVVIRTRSSGPLQAGQALERIRGGSPPGRRVVGNMASSIRWTAATAAIRSGPNKPTIEGECRR
jgi:hypothetical protein